MAGRELFEDHPPLNVRVEKSLVQTGVPRRLYEQALARISAANWNVPARRRAVLGYALALYDMEQRRGTERLRGVLSFSLLEFIFGVGLGGTAVALLALTRGGCL